MWKIFSNTAVVLLSLHAAVSHAQSLSREMYIDRLISEMTLEQKVAQLFVVRTEAVDTLVMEMPSVGGFCIFAHNFNGPTQLDSLISVLKKGDIRGENPLTPMICIDEEGGRVARIGGNPAFDVHRYPNMKTLGLKGEDATYEAGCSIGRYLHDYCIDVDFAPVADVDTNPENPVIGSRAFSSDPVEAGKLMVGFLRGLSESGVVGCLKHFPGHGDTSTDSHHEMATSLKSWDEMLGCEIIPFKAGIAAGASMVMIGHISAPNVTGDDLPATLSRIMVTDKLRGELGFEGVIITDSMAMQAVSKRFSPGEAAVRALEAGADILLMPADLAKSYTAVLDAVRSGRLSQPTLEDSLRRILSLKISGKF